MLWFGREKGNFASSTLICVSGWCLLNLLIFFVSHTSYILGAQRRHFSETVLLRTHNMCRGLVGRKVILHQALLSVCLVDVNSIYFSFYKTHIIYFGCSKESFKWDGSFKDPQHALWFVKWKGNFASSTLICVSGWCLLNLLKFL